VWRAIHQVPLSATKIQQRNHLTTFLKGKHQLKADSRDGDFSFA
jgi:hypothetical protein